jgi:hypothetical protein
MVIFLRAAVDRIRYRDDQDLASKLQFMGALAERDGQILASIFLHVSPPSPVAAIGPLTVTPSAEGVIVVVGCMWTYSILTNVIVSGSDKKSNPKNPMCLKERKSHTQVSYNLFLCSLFLSLYLSLLNQRLSLQLPRIAHSCF